MNWLIFPSLLAASLSLNPNTKNVSPGLGSRIVIRTQALLGSSEPGEYEVGAFKNKKDGLLSPGEKIDNVRVTPSKLFLRAGRPRNVVLSIPSDTLKPGPLWICLTEKPKSNKKSALPVTGPRFNLLVRTCYQRVLKPRKSILQRLLPQ